MPHFLHTVRICGTGPLALEAVRALEGLGSTVQSCIHLPWESPVQNVGSIPVVTPQQVAGENFPPVLLATNRPRKARKLLAPLAPELPLIDGIRDFMRILEQGLHAQHPSLFPDQPDPDSRRMFNYDRGLLPNRFLALMDEHVNSTSEAFARSGLSIGYPGWNLLYYSCLCSLRPGVHNIILETGTNVGCSTIVLAQALKDSGYGGEVVSADLDAKLLDRARENLFLAGVNERVRLLQKDGVSFVGNRGHTQPSPGDALSFVFLDDCHEDQHVLREFEALHPWLDAHSIVFFDNVDDPDGVAGALSQIQQRFGGNIVRFENASWNPPGQAVWQADGLAGFRNPGL